LVETVATRNSAKIALSRNRQRPLL